MRVLRTQSGDVTEQPARADAAATDGSKKQAHSGAAAERKVPYLDPKYQMQIVFENLTYTVPVLVDAPEAPKTGLFRRRSKKIEHDRLILNGVTGLFRPGRLTTVVGASGAGKTSLLTVLAGEARTGDLTGLVRVNGEEVYGKEMKRFSGFVFQDDVILATQTVREAILMSATLRLPKMGKAEREAKVDQMIDLLNLAKCRDTIIGDSSMKGISGGERKRVAMAMELVTDPAILFLDEPTSGLDTFTAFSVVKILKDLAALGRTVVATVHQPSSEIFHMFDDLMVLSEGHVIYHGEANKAIEYFAQRGYKCPQYTNPADYIFMSILNNQEDAEGAHADREVKMSNAERVQKLLGDWDRSIESVQIRGQVQNYNKNGVSQTVIKATSSFATQFVYLFDRASKNAFRNPLILRTRLFQVIFMGTFIGLLYERTRDATGMAAIQNRLGVLFFLTVNNVFASSLAVLSIFSSEKLVFMREYGAGYYHLATYFFSKVLVELPIQMLTPMISSTIIYWSVGLQNNVEKYFILEGLVSLAACCGFALGIFFACVFATLPTALALSPLILIPLMLFSGLFLNQDNIPVYMDWMKWVSPMRYSFESMIKNELYGLRIPGMYVLENGRKVPYTILGENVIKDYGFDNGLTISQCAAILLLLAVLLLANAYFALYRTVADASKSVTVMKQVKTV